MPDGWHQTVLGDLVDSPRGLQTGPYGSQLSASEYVPEGIPVLMPRNLRGGRIVTTKISRVTPRKAEQLEKYSLRRDDVLIARRGEVGRCALIDEEYAGAISGTGCIRARVNKDVSPSFLTHLLRWSRNSTWLKRNAVGQTMPNIATKRLASLPLVVPPLEEQERIAAVLSSLDRAIYCSKEILELTRKSKPTLTELLLQGRCDGWPHPGGSEELPSGWQQLPIGELCSFVNGHAFRSRDWSANGLPIIRIQNLNGSEKYHYFDGEPRQRWIVEDGDLLFAWAGSRGSSFGPHVWKGPKSVLNQHIYRIEPRQDVDREWLFATLKRLTRSIEEKALGFKASLLHVRKSDITDHVVPVPPLDDQRVLADQCRVLDQLEENEIRYSEAQEGLKQGLREDLLSGRVRTTSALSKML